MVKLVYTPDLKSCGQKCPYGFDSRPEHIKTAPQILVGHFCVFGGTKSGANITPFPNFLILIIEYHLNQFNAV